MHIHLNNFDLNRDIEKVYMDAAGILTIHFSDTKHLKGSFQTFSFSECVQISKVCNQNNI